MSERKNNKKPKIKISELTPRQIVKELDKFIIGQQNAKKSVAIALRNRWRRQQIPDNLREEIMPNNIILIGPTGVGKTEIARRLAKLVNAPFLKIEATKYTEIGYVGRDVDSMVRDLTEIGINSVKKEKSEEVKEKAIQIVEEKILDILLPPIKRKHDVELSQQIEIAEENSNTRTKFREQLRNGELDNKTIEIELHASQTPNLQVFGPLNMEEIGMNVQEMFENVMPKKLKKKKLTIAEARKILQQNEITKLIDMDTVVKEAIDLVQNSGIIFIDEFDKIAGSKSKTGPDVSREGVQRDLLPIVEGSNVNTKYGIVKTDHILFIASGAFHISKPSDLIPELQGRFPIRVELNSLVENDFIQILTVPQNALILQYSSLLKTEGIEIEFTDDGIKEIAKTAATVNAELEDIGARRLHTIMTTLLEDILFESPDNLSNCKITISKKFVEEKLSTIIKNQDLKKYIL